MGAGEDTRRRVVVTGAAGFVPAALVRRLVAGGAEVLGWVRPESDTWRLDGLAGHGLTLLRLDLRDLLHAPGEDAARAALAGFRPDAAVLGAWRGVRGAARDDAAQLDEVSVGIATMRVLADVGVRRLVGLGSQAEYGPHPGPISEESATRPASAYGAAKLALGHLLLAFARQRGVSAAWVRLFSVYGPGERSGALIPELARALAESRPFPLGPGDTRWDFLHERDAADALACLVGDDRAAGFFNLGSGRTVTIADVARLIAERVAPGAALALGERPQSPRDPTHLEANVDRLSGATGWAPRVPLDAGLAEAVAAVLARTPSSHR